MKIYNREEALLRMNRLGAEERPFVFMIDYEQKTAYVEEPDGIDPSKWLYQFNGFTNASPHPPLAHPIVWEACPQTLADYAASFRIVTDQIHAGNSYLVNLTCATPVHTNLTLEEVFHYAVATYKVWLKERFVVFSPEIFVRIVAGRIYSYPMKGTLDASLPDARKQLLADPKEEAEHATIVDLIRNDLSQVASSVTVSRYRYLDELKTNRGSLLQVSSEISGILPVNWMSCLGELLFRQLPAGSVTGAPKVKTLQIIAEAERYTRGFYTGVMGYFDGRQLDSAVMIRFLEQEGDHLVFKSGGGITSKSELLSEYNEMKQKVYVPIY